MSCDFERKHPRWGSRIARLYLAIKLFRKRKYYDFVITGRYGEYFALLQGIFKYRGKPHLLLDIEWYEERRNILLTLLKKFMNKLIARGAYRIDVFAEIEIERYSYYYGIDKNKFFWFPYTTDLEISQFDVKEENYIFTGGWNHRDYETFFQAVKDIPIKVMIAGPVEAVSKYRIISDNIVLMGLVNSREYYSIMAKSKLVVLSLEPGIRRCQGIITYVSAMRLGKAVVVNETEGTKSYIVNGKTGLIVPPKDPIALRNAIEKLLYDNKLRKEISQYAYQYAKDNFSTDRLIKELRKWTI